MLKKKPKNRQVSNVKPRTSLELSSKLIEMLCFCVIALLTSQKLIAAAFSLLDFDYFGNEITYIPRLNICIQNVTASSKWCGPIYYF